MPESVYISVQFRRTGDGTQRPSMNCSIIRAFNALNNSMNDSFRVATDEATRTGRRVAPKAQETLRASFDLRESFPTWYRKRLQDSGHTIGATTSVINVHSVPRSVE
jgi:hypothetical protein